MKKKYLDALTYLSSFDDGLSHYNWDRALTYKLKYGVHPGEFIKYFIDEGLIENKAAIGNSNYKLSSLGSSKVEQNKNELQSLNQEIFSSIEYCRNKGFSIETEIRLPLYQINYLGSKIKIFIHRTEEEQKVICFFPSETNIRLNELSLSVSMVKETEILNELLESHLKYLSILRSKPTA